MNLNTFSYRRRKRGGRGGGGVRPIPNNLAPQYSTDIFLQFLCETGKNHKCTKLRGKIIINVTLIWFEGTCKSIPFNSILEFSILSDFKMRNVINWHWFIKNLVGTWRRNDVDETLLRRIDVSTTSCACWEFGPPWHPQYSKSSYAYVSGGNSDFHFCLPLTESYLKEKTRLSRSKFFLYEILIWEMEIYPFTLKLQKKKLIYSSHQNFSALPCDHSHNT